MMERFRRHSFSCFRFWRHAIIQLSVEIAANLITKTYYVIISLAQFVSLHSVKLGAVALSFACDEVREWINLATWLLLIQDKMIVLEAHINAQVLGLTQPE